MTTEQKQYSKEFEYARSKVENGDWSWEQAFEYAAKAVAESKNWNWEQAFDCCKQACKACFK